MEGRHGALSALRALHYVYPFSIFIFYASASLVGVCMTRKELPKPAPRNVLHRITFCVMLGILGAHVSYPFTFFITEANTDIVTGRRGCLLTRC
jgi:hypothetical protein